MNKKLFTPEKYGMVVCPFCFDSGEICPKCGGAGYILNEGGMSFFKGVLMKIKRLFPQIIGTIVALFLLAYLYVENKFNGFSRNDFCEATKNDLS